MSGFAQKLIVAAALAFAALAPSVAGAHPGHSHARQSAAVTSEAQPADTKLTKPMARATAAAELKALYPASGSTPDDSACADRACCGNSACHAGPSVVAPMVAIAYPPSAGSTLCARDGPALVALARANLKRPPKRFA